MTLKLPTWDELMVIYPKSNSIMITDPRDVGIWGLDDEEKMAKDRILNLFPHPTQSGKLTYKTTSQAEGWILVSMYEYLTSLEGRAFGSQRHLGRPIKPKSKPF